MCALDSLAITKAPQNPTMPTGWSFEVLLRLTDSYLVISLIQVNWGRFIYAVDFHTLGSIPKCARKFSASRRGAKHALYPECEMQQRSLIEASPESFDEDSKSPALHFNTVLAVNPTDKGDHTGENFPHR